MCKKQPKHDGTTKNIKKKITTEKIIDMMRKNPNITMAEMARQCGLSEDGVYFSVSQLKKKGIIHREGARKNGHWIVDMPVSE